MDVARSAKLRAAGRAQARPCLCSGGVDTTEPVPDGAERASLDQSYDSGRYGRFGRYLLGAGLVLEHPLGIGPLQFYRYFTEDPHNSFLNAFVSGGWLSGCAYLALSLVTLAMGARIALLRTPWQPTYHAVYAAYAAIVVESIIIDIDHWRHYFLVLGVLWGLMAASHRHRSHDCGGAAVLRP
jgi:hypothetical protein